MIFGMIRPNVLGRQESKEIKGQTSKRCGGGCVCNIVRKSRDPKLSNGFEVLNLSWVLKHKQTDVQPHATTSSSSYKVEKLQRQKNIETRKAAVIPLKHAYYQSSFSTPTKMEQCQPLRNSRRNFVLDKLPKEFRKG